MRASAVPADESAVEGIGLGGELLSSVLGSLPGLVLVLDERGRVLWANPRLARTLGYRSARDLEGAGFATVLAGADLTSIERLRSQAADGTLNDRELALLTATGGRVPAVFSGGLLKAPDGRVRGVTLVGREIRESRLMRELARQRSLIESALQHVGDALIVADRTGEILFRNRAAEALSPGGAGEPTLLDPASREPLPVDRLPLTRAILGERVDGDELLFRSPGEPEGRLLSCTALPVRGEQGDLAGAVVVLRDLSARRRAQAELEEARARLAQSEKLAVVGQMAGGVAHEINNPLAVIQGTSETLRDLLGQARPCRKTADDLLRHIEHTTLRISRIVRGMHSVIRGGAGDPFVEADLVEIVENTLTLCHSRIVRKGTTLSVDLGEAPHWRVQCRPDQISQILMNLVSNAVDAVAELPPEAERWIHCGLHAAGEWVDLVVEDGGRGVPEPVRERLFEPFVTTKGVGRGTGLGLSITRTLVQAHRGVIEYHPGPPTRFVVRIPRRQPGS